MRDMRGILQAEQISGSAAIQVRELAYAWLTLTRKRSRHLLAALASALLGLAALEVSLRILPLKRASSLANDVYTAYGSFPGGIYFTEPQTRMNFMVPGFETENFWNGYSWRHRTDELGFRNPPGLRDRSLLLLGDSLIYGHGVEEEWTVAHLLRTRYRLPAYNMARQGDCLYQQYILVRLYLDELKPRTVVLFGFFNDFRDLLFYRTAEELEQMPETRLDFAALRDRVAKLGRDPEYPFQRYAYRLRTLRLLRGLARSLQGEWIPRAEAAAPDPLAAVVLEEDPFHKASRYYRRALADLHRRTTAAGAGLQVVLLDAGPVVGPAGERANERMEMLLLQASRETGFSFVTTRDVFTGCGDCLLPRDGHLSPQGHARLARFLAPRLRPRKAGFASPAEEAPPAYSLRGLPGAALPLPAASSSGSAPSQVNDSSLALPRP